MLDQYLLPSGLLFVQNPGVSSRGRGASRWKKIQLQGKNAEQQISIRVRS